MEVWTINPAVAKLWEEEGKKYSPQTRAYIAYAAELFMEELGLKPKGSTPPFKFIEPDYEAERMEEKRHG